MPKLLVPDQQDLGSAGTPIESNTISEGALKIGNLQQDGASSALADASKLGQVQGTEGAAALAQTGDIGKIEAAGAQQAAQSYSDIGQTAMNAGQAVMNLGNQYFEKAEGAIQDGIYNNAFAGASKEFSKRVQDRINKPFDDKGNPTFSTLSSDIAGIASDVQSKYGGSLGNPEVANRFNSAFTELSTSNQIMAMKQARDQQIQYSQGASTTGQKQTIINALGASPEMVPGLLAKGNQDVDNAVRLGIWTPEQGVLQKENLKNSIVTGRLSIMAQKDPVGTAMQLNNPNSTDPTIQALNPIQRAKAVDETTTRLIQLSRQNRQQEAEAKNNQQALYNFNTQDMDLAITQGTAGPAEIQAAYTAGHILHSQYVNLMQKSYAATGDTAKKTATRQQIGTAMNQGQILQGKYSDSDVNDYYNYQQKLTGIPNISLFDPNAPTDQSRIAANLKAPVTDYTNSLKGAVEGGTPEQVLAAVQGYNYVQQKNPIAVSQIDPKTRAVLYSVQSQMTYGNVPAAQAINSARATIMQQDPSVQVAREKAFDNEDMFKTANLNSTIHSIYDTSTLGSVFKGTQSGTLDPNDTSIITGLLKQNYMYLGDAQQAVDLTKQQTKGIWGATNINPQTGTNKPIMFMPPEFSYPQYNFSVNGKPAMRINLENDVKPMLTDSGWAPHQADIPLNSISIEPNRYAPARQLGQTSYQVFGTITGSNGVSQQVPIVDPKTGQPMTWTPDDGFIKNLKQQQYDSGVQNSVQTQQNAATSGTNIMGDPQVPAAQSPTDDSLRSQYGQPPLPPTQVNPDGTKTLGINNTTSDSMGAGTRDHVINTALQYLGMNEVAHKQVLGNLISQMVGSSTDPSTTPWCAGFVNAILKMNGIQGSGSMSAQSLLNVGQPTNNPQKGDLVVFNRGGGLGHVGFYMGTNADGSILVLGGNQGGDVSVKSFGRENLMGFRSLPNGDDAKALMTGQNTPQQQNVQGNDPSYQHPVPAQPNGSAQPYDGDNVALALSNMPNKALPIGIRQNNPGNVAKNGNQWDGELPNSSSRFKEFSTPEDGIAAIARVLSQYNNKYQVNTINGIVHRYSATDQGEYAKNLSAQLGVDPNEPLNVNDLPTMVKLVKGIIKQENGYVPYDDRTIVTGIMRNRFMAQTVSPQDNAVASAKGIPKSPKDLTSDNEGIDIK